jgi:hypothetical protein
MSKLFVAVKRLFGGAAVGLRSRFQDGGRQLAA